MSILCHIKFDNTRLFRFLLVLISLTLFANKLFSQTPVDHWETAVYDSMKWRYWPGTGDPGASWNQPAYNDINWQQGRGGIGYGDGDDRTVISPVISVFLRKKFTITNKSKIVRAVLHADYDDGFIAYLNGVEIARANMGTQTVVTYNQSSSGLHEANIYQGQKPQAFLITESTIQQLIVEGENTLAIQVHNESLASSDLSSNMFLSLGIIDQTTSYLLTPTWFSAPQEFTSSNLPIVILNTGGQTIPDDPRITVNMAIIDYGEGSRNLVNYAPNIYNGKVSIELRGESSLGLFPKKSYTIETQDGNGNVLNVPLLGMPPENDWVLYAPYTDKTMMRDVLAYELGRRTGHWAPHTRFVELVLNGNYEGVYVLMERIKIDKNRVDIATLKPTDISGAERTGGYLLRVDKLDANDYPGWRATPYPQLVGENDITFQYFDPDGEDLAAQQRDYIQNYIRTFQNSLTNVNFTNPNSGFKHYLDVPATVDFMIINEIGKNIDAYIFSTYLYKDKDKNGIESPLVMGPLWDFNLAFGNVDYWQNAQVAPGWMYADQYRMFWFRRMMLDPYFAAMFTCRWQELRSTWLTNDFIFNTIDSYAALLNESQQRNYQRWPILGTYVWPNQYIGQTYADEVNFLKTWIAQRLLWMDNNMPGSCSLITAANDHEASIQIFPNPFTSQLTIQTGEMLTNKQITITNLLGLEIFTAEFSASEFEWDGRTTSGSVVPAGVYVLTVTDAQGKTLAVKRLIRG